MFILIEFDKVYKELPKDWFDSGKLKWEPNIQLEDIIESAWKWQKGKL